MQCAPTDVHVEGSEPCNVKWYLGVCSMVCKMGM